jgi:hypothetical protein
MTARSRTSDRARSRCGSDRRPLCRETTASFAGLNLSNIAGRTFKVNGVAFVANGSISALPAKVNGGYCLQATAGGLGFASFATW